MSQGTFGRASAPYASAEDMTLRARVFVPPVLTWITRNATAELRMKNRRELRQEAALWAICGSWRLARRLWSVRPSPPVNYPNATGT